MRIGLISDTHGQLPPIPSGIEAIIHAGDIGPDRHVPWWTKTFRQWCIDAKVPIYATFGNHDFIGQNKAELREIEEYLPGNIHFYVDQAATIGNREFFFMPWVTNLPNWAFNLSEEQAAAQYRAVIPNNVDFIVSHAPPFGIGDSLRESAAQYKLEVDARVGGKALRNHLNSMTLTRRLSGELPPTVICGHIHEDRGLHITNDIMVINVASTRGKWSKLNDNYEVYPERWTFLDLR